MEPKAIEKIAQRLDAAGHDSGELHDLQVELDILEKPPSFWQRMHRSAQEFASRQWEMLAGELQESKLAMQITVKALRSRDSVTAEELHFVREQMMDLLRVLPAGAVIFANAALPLPATSILTPRILHKLGLMPSMWREAHLLSHLQDEVNRLRALGLDGEASEIEEIVHEIESEVRCKEQLVREARLLPHWDLDGNGRWDPEERQAYSDALDKVVSQLEEERPGRIWYLLEEDEVFGPFAAGRLHEFKETKRVLICRSGDQSWVSLFEVLVRWDG
jgi:hypothetical protein